MWKQHMEYVIVKNMSSVEKLVLDAKKGGFSDRTSQTLYLSKSLVKEVRTRFPGVPLSRLIEAALKDLLQKKRSAA